VVIGRNARVKTPIQQYQARQAKYSDLVQKQERADRLTGNLRLVVFIGGAGAAGTLYLLQQLVLAGVALFAFAALFIALVIRHAGITREIKYYTALREINSLALSRMAGEWDTFSDNGEEFVDQGHSYTWDLDIFGPNSLFQWINSARTFRGRQKFAKLLAGEFGEDSAILARQAAVAELGPQLTWRQSFQAQGMLASGKLRNPGDIIAWAGEEEGFFQKPWTIIGARALPILTVTLCITGFALNLVSWTIPSLALVLQLALLAYKRKERARTFAISERYGSDLRVYYKMIKVFEEHEFQSPLLRGIKAGMRNKLGLPCNKQMSRLASIVDSMGNRRNMFYILFNIVLMWDFQIIIALEKWKRESGKSLGAWFEALGDVEVLASLAQISFENPDWAKPRLCPGKPSFTAREIGHPLLIGRRVNNDLALAEDRKVLLITGSNMSGKSTLLRTAGINLVLAYAGAPVCASSFSASLMKICSCMRVTDNLKESISSFYAELLRIKLIVQQAESGCKVFFLLDEVFKGTNSTDRHAGAKVLVNKLSGTDSIGLVSTHDLELCDLEAENPKITNYHFREYYTDGKLNFDYKLRPGPSTTRNALYLMRLAGIEIEE